MHGWTRHATLAPLTLVALLAGCNGDAKMNQQALLDENRDLRAELDRSRGSQDDADARSIEDADGNVEDDGRQQGDPDGGPGELRRIAGAAKEAPDGDGWQIHG